MEHKPFGVYEKFIKRPLDLIFALFTLILLFPVMLIIALLVRIKLGSPVFFKQERPGRSGKIFTLYKFRSMLSDQTGDIDPKKDAERMTPFGRKLRATSLDELPELINILRGDMSFVGPRPLLIRYLERYTPHQARRHEVRPGLTGLAQVHGRNAISWEEKFDWDIRYVDRITFAGDCRIIFETVKKTFRKEGITASGEATMGEFMGTNDRLEISAGQTIEDATDPKR